MILVDLVIILINIITYPFRLVYMTIFTILHIIYHIMFTNSKLTGTTIIEPDTEPIPDDTKQFPSLLEFYVKPGQTVVPIPVLPVKPTSRQSNQFMTAAQKSAHLKSSYYRKLRQQVLKRDNYACVHCGSLTDLNVHHITYFRLKAEELADLVTLCVYCHSKLHEIAGYDRGTLYPVSILKKQHETTS